jgi:type IV secretory pathway VirD2 relaxase
MPPGPPNRDDADEDDYLFRPRLGSRRGSNPERGPSFRALIARSIAKQGGRKSGHGRAASRLGRISVRPPHELSRRCVIKTRYIAMTGTGRSRARSHLKYLERDGVERDGSPGRLYGADGAFDAEAFRAPVDQEPRQFRFIISPEDAHLLDLTIFTRQLMKQVEKDTGRRLDWAAVNHHNTDNPHVHVIVRGLDRDGDEVRIDGRYIAQEMRWRAQEIATRELGPRLESELSRSRNSEIERDRYTDLDREIESLAKADRTVHQLEILLVKGGEGRHCIGRLQNLEALQLAKIERPGVWRLEEGWTKSLRELGEYKDVLDRLTPLVGNRAVAFRVVDERKHVAPFEGRVVGKGLDDELGGRMFVAVQAADGKSFYVRGEPEIAETVREGDTIRVGFEVERWVKSADRIIARFAQANGGVYDPTRHKRELESLPPSSSATGEPTPEQRVTANIRRLERLERFQLVKPSPDGRWHVRADLLAQLEDRERTHPQHRLRMERVGVGLSQERIPARANAVSELAALADTSARELRLVYVAEQSGFKGRVMECVVAPSGREYVRVVDDRRGQFTLIPKPPDWERVRGRTVELSRVHAQELVIRLDLGLSR